MESISFTINRDYHEWIRRAQEEGIDADAAEIRKEIAKDTLDPTSRSWGAITVLQSFRHGLCGDLMHYIRIDSFVRNLRGVDPVSVYKCISDAELQEMRQCIVEYPSR